MEVQRKVLQIIQSTGLEATTSNHIREKFIPFLNEAEKWRKTASSLVVNDASQKREMKMAREARLALRAIRIDADKTRKELKDDSLRYGKAVQGVYNVIEYLVVPIEKHLEQQEKFVEIQEAKRKAELKVKREMEIEPYAEYIPSGIDFEEMSDDDYAKLLNGVKLQMKHKIEEEQRLEAERIAREKAEAEERERIKQENERLKKEAEERERKLAQERADAEAKRKAYEEIVRKEREVAETKARKEKEEAEAKLKAEREERAKLAAEIQAKADAEATSKREAEERAAKELKDKQDAINKAKSAPDKEKLLALAFLIENLDLPEMTTEGGKNTITNVKTLIYKLSDFIRTSSSKI